jgi:hypothetical protein
MPAARTVESRVYVEIAAYISYPSKTGQSKVRSDCTIDNTKYVCLREPVQCRDGCSMLVYQSELFQGTARVYDNQRDYAYYHTMLYVYNGESGSH